MINLIYFAEPVTGNFLVDIIKWLIQISSSIALGVILFTVILKLITLPFDFFSRVSMRKNSLKMEQMRPELEKLQKQYANDKNLYSQKMMALYKKNGYSMWGSCLPTIITLVIFIVAINAFTSYSQYQNREYFYNMSLAYNNVVYAGLEEDGTYIKFEDGTYKIDYEGLKNAYVDDTTPITNENNSVKIFLTKVENSISIQTENGYTKHTFTYSEEGGVFSLSSAEDFEILTGKLNTTKETVATARNNYLKINGKTFTEYNTNNENPLDEPAFIKDICQEKSAESFRSVKKKFLWVKNIWVTDSPMAHPIEANWDTFKTTYKYGEEESTHGMQTEDYNNLIAKLSYEANEQVNGYFILAVLTAGISFLTQFVMSKSQKAQMELQTVDGQGAQTQKMMMWMMPIMMAFFSFMYTAAFSIYMIISSVFSILTTLGINWVVDKKFAKNLKNQSSDKVRGRIHTPEVKEEPKKDTKVKKTDKPEVGDFITGPVKKNVRGRLK